MKYTLLELTQLVLDSIDGDEVNSIGDTVESQQIVSLIRRVYGNIAEGADYPPQYGLFKLTASGDAALPAIMYLPVGTFKNMSWLKYNARTVDDDDDVFQEVAFLELNEFLRRMHSQVPSEDATLETMTPTIDGVQHTFIIANDRAPQFFTTPNDTTLIFDSYDSALDTTLQASKTMAYGEKTLEWTESDGFIIPIPDHQLLLNESVALAWAEQKQTTHAKAEQTSRMLKTTMQRKKHAIDPMQNYRTMTTNYGRK